MPPTWKPPGSGVAGDAAQRRVAYPVALLLARLNGWRARLLLVIVLLPLWKSLLVRTFAWLVLLQRHGLINSTLLALGVIDAPLALVNNVTGTVIGMTRVIVRFVVLPLTAALQAVDPLVCRATQSLGANRWRAFWGVVFPLSLNGVLSGATPVFPCHVARLLCHPKLPRRRQPAHVVQPHPDQYRDLSRLGRTSEGASVTVVS